MSQTYIADFKNHDGQEVVVRGWLYNKRSKGKLHFLILRDGSGYCQAVVGQQDVPAEVFELCGKIGQESSLTATGTVRADARAPGGFELQIKAIEVHQNVADYPIAKIGEEAEGPGADYLLERRHLWLRSKKQHAVIRVRSRIEKAIRDFFDDRGFTLVDSPVFTPSACEGTTTLFEVKYFEDKAYLTQSGQLYVEAAAQAHGKVYCFGPTFRAEKSKTRKHLTEFWMVEPEIAYATLDDIMKLAEEFMCHIIRDVVAKNRTDLEALGRDVAKLEAVTPPFPRISYTDVVERLNKEGHAFPWGEDFGAPEEAVIGSWSAKPVMVHRWPKDIKAFYMAPDPENPKVVLGCDVIAPEGKGEIIGGAQRAHSLEYLEAQIAHHGLPKEAFEWYLDLRRYGAAPSAGFGMGLERMTAWVTGVEHVRECIPFPRTIYRIYP